MRYEIEKFIFPEPYIILYEILKPFSLGHLFLLSRVGLKNSNDFLQNKKNIFLAIYICSRDYDEVWEDIKSGKYLEWLKKKEKFFKNKKYNLIEEIEIFFDYIKICSEHISYWSKSSGKKTSSNSDDLTNYLFICTYALNELHLDIRTILTMPLGFLITLCIVDLARKEIVDIKTQEDETLIEYAKNYKQQTEKNK